MSTPGKARERLQPTQILLGKGDSPSSSHLESLLPKIGYEAIVANDGLEAREVLLKSDAPPLAVLDATMAGISAVDLCRELRGERRPHFTYLIVFSSWTEQLQRIAALEAGADDCLPSPIDIRELQLRLEKGSQVILARALERSESFLRAITGNVNDLIFVLNDQSRWVYANPSHKEYLGYETRGVAGARIDTPGPPRRLRVIRKNHR